MYVFTEREIKELLLSAVVITIVFTWPNLSPVNFALFFLFIGLGFVIHEIAHKLTAQSLGAWSEFVMWKDGLLLALLLKVTTGATIVAPGATYWVKPLATLEEQGKVALAGPLSNVILALAFKLAAAIFPVMRFGAYINAQLALFNLLPLPPLDGVKIMRWNFVAWLLTGLMAYVLI